MTSISFMHFEDFKLKFHSKTEENALKFLEITKYLLLTFNCFLPVATVSFYSKRNKKQTKFSGSSSPILTHAGLFPHLVCVHVGKEIKWKAILHLMILTMISEGKTRVL